MDLCLIKGCDRRSYCKGLCSTHYNRQLKTGTVKDGPKARLPLAERFWKNVDKRADDECWPWIGKSLNQGYGYIGIGGRNSGKLLSHRAAWILTHGDIPGGDGHHGTVVMHTCDNRLCCNPAHLRLGTQGENVKDMDVKGRRKTVTKCGESHHNSRFTEADIRRIRSSPLSNVELSREYGCARQVIGLIRRRVTWRHIP